MIASIKGEVNVKGVRSKTGPQIRYRPVEEDRGKAVLREEYRGSLTWMKIREMRKHPTIAMVRQLIIAPAMMAPWTYREKKGAPAEAAEFIEKQVDHLRQYLVRTCLFGCIDYGWQSFEKIFGKKDGKIVLAEMKALLPDFTQILIDKNNGAFKGLRERNMWYGFWNYLDVKRSFLHSFDVEGTYWYGSSYMANVEDAYDNWHIANDANVRYDEKIAGSHWVVHYPVGTSVVNGVEKDNEEIAQEILAALQSSGGIACPKRIEAFIDELDRETPNSWQIELLSDKGATQTNFLERMAYLDKLLVRGFGFPERSILEGKYGTKAEAETHADFAVTNILLRTNDLILAINKQLVNQLLSLNWGPEAIGTVCIEAGSIGSDNRAFLRDVYMKLIADQKGFVSEFAKIDMDRLREILVVPTDEDLSETDLFEIHLKKLEEQAKLAEEAAENGILDPFGSQQPVREDQRGQVGRPEQFRRSGGNIGSNNVGDNTSGREDRGSTQNESVQGSPNNVVTNRS